MAKQVINIGRTANDRSGDPLRSAFIKINDNFTELYTLTGGTAADLKELAQDYAAEMFTGGTHSGIIVTYNDATNKINLTVPAGTSGDYNDLTNKPDLSVYALTTDIPNVSSFITAADIPAIPADISDLTDTTGLLGQGGTANTGDIQFLDSEIFTTTGNLTFYNTGAPEGEFNRIDFESDRFTVDVSQDINLTAGTDLELTVNNASGSAKTFTFGTTGILTFPDATIQSSAFTGIAKSVIQVIDSDATINTSRNVATNNLYTNPTDFVSDLIPTGFDYVFAGLAQRNETQIEVTLFVPPAGIFQTFLTGIGLGRTVVATYSTASGTSTITGPVSQGFQVIGQYDPTTGWIRVTGRIDGIVPTGYTGLVSINFPIYNTESYTWAFNDTGGLTFPDNTVQTTAYTGSGTANTGSITFADINIYGATSMDFPLGGITLVPHRDVIYTDFGQYVDIYPTVGNDAPHIHIAAGKGSASTGDLILGDDNYGVDVNHNGYIGIKSHNAVTGNSSLWYFGNDGVLSGPGMGQVFVPSLAGSPGNDLYLNAGNAYLPQGQFIQFSDADGTAKTSYTVDATTYPLVGIPQSPYATLFLSPGNNTGISFVPGEGVWTAVFGQAVTLQAGTDYWLEYASIQSPSVYINTDNGSWGFKNNGALENSNSWTRVTMPNIGSGPSAVVWTSNVDYISGAKLTIQVEAHEVSDDTGWHSQVCEAVIASRGYMSSAGGPGGEPVMTVYGVTHTSTVPLVTFTVQRNPTTKNVEVVGTLTAAATSADLRIYSVETSTRD